MCPFHYFGVYDQTDLSDLQWKRGGYDLAALSNVFTGNDARTRIVLKEVRDKVADVSAMRALGFCVGVDHARRGGVVVCEVEVAGRKDHPIGSVVRDE